jgi:hypothetical protein
MQFRLEKLESSNRRLENNENNTEHLHRNQKKITSWRLKYSTAQKNAEGMISLLLRTNHN